MANVIKQKRGTTNPTTSDLVVGELALNTTDGGVFTKTDGGSLIEVGLTDTVYNLTGTALDPGNGAVQYKTLGANTTFTDSVAAGEAMILHLADGSSYTATWPSMIWTGGSAPTLPTTGYAVVVLWKFSLTLYGAHVGDVA
tara:strand:- start:6090 stop:6512 length:423 start_codon:yes stop_codon:yes gene_type:complete